jgi:hypothetical protein
MKQDTSSRLRYPDWQPEYEAALLELDHNTLEERVLAARRAISNRVQVLAQDHFGSPEGMGAEAVGTALPMRFGSSSCGCRAGLPRLDGNSPSGYCRQTDCMLASCGPLHE